MSFFTTILNAFTSQQGQGDDRVLEVASKDYSRIPITFRRDCLVLHGPKNDKFELLLLKPLTPSRSTTDFSLFRANNKEDALEKINSIQETLITLVQMGEKHVMNRYELQNICDFLKEKPSYSAGHVIVSLEYSWGLVHPKLISFVNLQCFISGLTPLHIAIIKQNPSMIESLIKMGANLKEKDFKGNFIYHLAAITNPKIIQILSKSDKSSINFQNNDGKSALHVACENDKPQCVSELLKQGADVNMAATMDAAFPIHTAVNAGSATCVNEIIRMYPNMLSINDVKDGGTPLHWCMSKDMIVSLIEHGCLIDARNFRKASALHKMVVNDRFECVVSLVSHGADVNILDDNGNSPLHYATSVLVLQALLVFRAEINLQNKQGETIRHRVAANNYKDKNLMLYYLNCLDAIRCQLTSSSCSNGCAPQGKFDGVPPDVIVQSRIRSSYDELLAENLFHGSSTTQASADETLEPKRGRVLCLDGGGIKGLVLIQLLRSVEEVSNTTINQLFDWIAGTSTGAILAIAVAMGLSLQECMEVYFKMKDKIFCGSRPYDDTILCDILKEKFGETTVMSDIITPRLIIPAVRVNTNPADLHLFRNYFSGELVCQDQGQLCYSQNVCQIQPNEQLVWKAARASSAAPTYFEPFEDFVDGGIISNNPTLDALTEIAEYNNIQQFFFDNKYHPVSLVLSLGVGKPPVIQTNNLSNMQRISYLKNIRMAFSIPDVARLLIDQATMADNHSVDRARAWCGQCGIRYLRFSPQLSEAVEMDENRDDVIINMLWETLLYAHVNKPKIISFVQKLKLAGGIE